MKNFLFLILLLAAMAVPVHAAPDEGVLDGIVATDASTPADPELPLEDSVEDQAVGEDAAALASSDSLAGGYYFVADCVLGYGLKFYVPLEWADDVFTLDGSGSPVNLSNSTCYAYCPDYPDYTISCSRFSTFTYRASNYNTADLQLTNISETNISFLEDETQRLSQHDLLLLIAGLIFLFGAAALVLRR